jgi:hypothetical protein
MQVAFEARERAQRTDAIRAAMLVKQHELDELRLYITHTSSAVEADHVRHAQQVRGRRPPFEGREGRECERGFGGLAREVGRPSPSNSPRDQMTPLQLISKTQGAGAVACRSWAKSRRRCSSCAPTQRRTTQAANNSLPRRRCACPGNFSSETPCPSPASQRTGTGSALGRDLRYW